VQWIPSWTCCVSAPGPSRRAS